MLKPHDVVVCVKLLQSKGGDAAPTYASLASALRLSSSEVHAAVNRALDAGLLRKPSAESGRTMPLPVASALAEFLVHGIKYIWPVKRGAISRGMPTGNSLDAISYELGLAPSAVPAVWAHHEGAVRGELVEPLYPRASEACLEDGRLHEWLALIDLVRMKTGREAALAAEAIKRRLA